MAVSKRVIVAIVVGLGFVAMVGAAGVGFVGWRYYSAYMASKALATAQEGLEAPTGTEPEAPAAVATPEATAAEPSANIEPAPTGPTVESTPAAESASPSPSPASVAKRTAKPKTAAASGRAPKALAEADRRTPPKPEALDVGHVHGGLRKKTSPGVIYLLATGFKYDSKDADDDVHIDYRFDQIKKVEIDDPTTVEVATVDKKWKFRGEGLTISKIATHLNAHSGEFSGK